MDWNENLAALQTKLAAYNDQMVKVAQKGDVAAVLSLSTDIRNTQNAIETLNNSMKAETNNAAREAVSNAIKKLDFSIYIRRGIRAVVIGLAENGEHTLEFLDKVPGKRAPRTSTAQDGTVRTRIVRYFNVAGENRSASKTVALFPDCKDIEQVLAKHGDVVRELTDGEIAAAGLRKAAA